MEKICRKHLVQTKATQRYNRYLKRAAHRWMRRLGKEELEDAPRKYHYSGWSD